MEAKEDQGRSAQERGLYVRELNNVGMKQCAFQSGILRWGGNDLSSSLWF